LIDYLLAHAVETFVVALILVAAACGFALGVVAVLAFGRVERRTQ
jgi:hypothetical protein